MSLNFDDCIGREIAPPSCAAYPVSEAMIVHWCEALDDDPARYVDSHGRHAPATMLHIFNMSRAALLRPMPGNTAMNRLDAAGFTAPLATNYEQDYGVPLRAGDIVTQQMLLESVSAEKSTPMGQGHFVGMRFIFTNQRGQEVGRQLMRVFKYRPAATPHAMTLDVAARPWSAAAYPPAANVAERDRTRPPAAGEMLPELAVELTPSRIVLGAIASNDAMAVHHDKDSAIAGGVPSIFMNIMTQNGWVGRYVHQWAGPGVVFKRIALRLGVPNVAHDTMTLAATVTAVTGCRAALDVRSRNRLGEPLRASVDIEWPSY